MNILIFEDEKHTANRLQSLLKEADNSINVIAVLNSVKSGIKWLKENDMPDLIFQDIILSDGNCFEIFDKVEINVPIIFTTAFSEYALRSFQVNSIDYIIKPYDIKDIKSTLEKYKKFKGAFQPLELNLLDEILNKKTITPKTRFLIRTSDNYFTVNSKDIAVIASEDGVTTATLFNNKKHIVDFAVEALSKQMDPILFFQINRKIIINIESVVKISSWFNSRLKVQTNPSVDDEMIVSRERVKSFKEWLDG